MQPRLATDELTLLHHLLRFRQAKSGNTPMDSDALEQLFSRCMSVLERLRPALISATLPVPKKTRKLVRDQNAVLQLLIDELYSFHDKNESLIAHEHPYPAPRALWRILYILSQRFLISHLTAGPVPSGVWQQFKQIYARVADQDQTEHDPSSAILSPRKTYFKALLLSCANPESLSPPEIDFVWHYLDRFANAAIPVTSNRFEGNERFWIDKNSDTGPVACSRKMPPPDTAVLFLSWPQMEDLLRRQLNAIEGDLPGSDLELPVTLSKAARQGVLAHLHATWGAPAKRRYPRRRQIYRAEICTGLDSLWHLLKGSNDVDPETARWMIINESPDGYAAMHISGKTGLVAVGDIAAIRTETGNEWQICIVRRALSENQEHLELGLQILGSHAASAVLAIPDNQHSKQIPVLVLPGIETLGISEMIVAASGLIENKKGQVVLVIEKKNLEIREVRTKEVSEQNSWIELFSIQQANLDD